MGNKSSNSPDVAKAEPRDIRRLIAELGFDVPSAGRGTGCSSVFQTRFELGEAAPDQTAAVVITSSRPHQVKQLGRVIGVLAPEFDQYVADCMDSGYRFSGRILTLYENEGFGTLELVGAPHN